MDSDECAEFMDVDEIYSDVSDNENIGPGSESRNTSGHATECLSKDARSDADVTSSSIEDTRNIDNQDQSSLSNVNRDNINEETCPADSISPTDKLTDKPSKQFKHSNSKSQSNSPSHSKSTNEKSCVQDQKTLTKSDTNFQENSAAEKPDVDQSEIQIIEKCDVEKSNQIQIKQEPQDIVSTDPPPLKDTAGVVQTDSKKDGKSKTEKRSSSRSHRSSRHKSHSSKGSSKRKSSRRSRSRSPKSKRDSRKSSSKSKKRKKKSRSSSSDSCRHSPSRKSTTAPSSKRRKLHSPFSQRKRHNGSKENPLPSPSIVLFGIPISFKEPDLINLIPCQQKNLPSPTSASIATDGQKGLSRGFGFLNFDSVDSASSVKSYLESSNELTTGSWEITCKFSITQRAHSPTPNYYLGCKKTMNTLGTQ